MKPTSNVETYSFRGISTISWRALAGIIVLISIPGVLSIDERIGDVVDDVSSRINGGISSSENVGKLTFKRNGGFNVEIENDGLLAYKKREEVLYGVALTSRHLLPKDFFEIKVERNTKPINGTGVLAIGLTNVNIADEANLTLEEALEFWKHIESLHLWQISSDDDQSRPNIQEFNKNGSRMGLKINENGTFNIFANGNDFGNRPYNIADPFYVAVEFMTMGLQASIINN